ncbi:unnamed protein product [Kuraishia capsulata CBS 1993]|uniref:AB hydrolase-1 domain-containing protein n=1 Tax=Kuraishia capsulata CBS 1993 TaxID=1382522 RepID=W6MUK7_9ASCO|nr:uncharacterized protein KUCA_T00005350001 [Kuraishia capsulata CBS 1993]CDK29362.1 unnamed protein product [Kuraishia capsulata CBS 1993]
MSYTKTDKTIAGAYPRSSRWSTLFEADRLSVVYTVFEVDNAGDTGEEEEVQKGPLVNLIFDSGNCCNRAIWYYHIERLIELGSSKDSAFRINSAITFDRVNQGDSAVVNQMKLGPEYEWKDGARDILEIVRRESQDRASCFWKAGNQTVVVGHSMGGYEALCATCMSPQLFVGACLFEPVVWIAEDDWDGFSLIMAKVYAMLQTEFKDETSYSTYWRTKSFHRSFQERPLQDFLDTDRLVEADGSVRNKTLKDHMMCNYAGGIAASTFLAPLLKGNPTPSLHVIGAKARWNPARTNSFLQNTMPDCEARLVEGAIHSVNCDQADISINLISETIVSKAIPEILARREKDKISANAVAKSSRAAYAARLASEAVAARLKQVKKAKSKL